MSSAPSRTRIRITDIQRFSIHDGPGIRTTLFFQGCPLRCQWCQNPECQTPGRKLRMTASRCIGCGECVAACPSSAHSVERGAHHLDRSRCEVCGRCAEVCPTGALGISGEDWTPEEIMRVVRRDRPFYDASRGGMTLSGGEPLWQPEGARELLGIAKAEAIHTAVETCGSVEWPVMEPMLSVVDLWLYDLKHLDREAHERLTGRGNEEILANLERLLAVGAALALRVPVIPGRNDDGWLFDRLPTWLRSHPGVREVHLMPYNRLAESKYRSLGWDYALRGVEPPPEESTKALAERLREADVEVRVGG